jgi:polyisoprenyl-phosphate glycosyltransferase
MTTQIDIICPVYREETTILAFHQALEAATQAIGEISFRYVYVVDPSTDRSEEILRDLAERNARVSVIVMSRRFGHQAALVAGLDACRGDAVVMLDSDLQHPPSLIQDLVQHWRNGADIVQAVRQHGPEMKIEKRLPSDIFYRLFDQLAGMPIRSGAADYRLLSRRVVDVFRDQLREHNPFLRGLVTWVGYDVAYVPFTPGVRAGGESKYSIATLVTFAANGLLSFSKLPLRLCALLGLAFAVLSIVGGLANVLVYFLASDTYAPGWASLFAFITFAFGIVLFFLGVIGEYIGLIFDEVKGRPRYLVRTTYGPTVGDGRDVPRSEQVTRAGQSR